MRTQFSKFAQVAGIMLALAFTFNCSDDKDEGGSSSQSGGGDVSSSSGGNSGGGSSPSGSGNTFKDDRDGKSYKWVKIGEQVWMAENLNYGGGDWCDNHLYHYDGSTNYCTAYGMLYSWAHAMLLFGDIDCNKNSCASQISAKHKGICPSGWHIPSKDEWQELVDFAGGVDVAIKKLKTKSGWGCTTHINGDDSYTITDCGGGGYESGTDDYGFSALPGGYQSGNGLSSVGYYGYWWSATENNKDAYELWIPDHRDDGFQHIVYIQRRSKNGYSNSVRCIKD